MDSVTVADEIDARSFETFIKQSLNSECQFVEMLHHPLESIMRVEREIEMLEVPSATQYKNFTPGKRCLRYTFTDGTQYTQTWTHPTSWLPSTDGGAN